MNTPLVWRTPFSVWAQQPANRLNTEIAAADDGSYFVAWTLNSGTVVAQRRDATGNPIGNPVLLSNTGNPAEIISVGSNSVVLVSLDSNGYFVATYDANLNLLHRSPLPQIYSPDVTRNSNGGIFIVANDFSNVVGFAVDQSGAVSNPIIISSGDPYGYANPKVATLDNGRMVVVNDTSSSPSGRHYAVMRISDATGSFTDAPITLGYADPTNTRFPAPNITNPEVTALHSGGFVVTWSAGGGNVPYVNASIFDSSGQVVREPFLVNFPGIPTHNSKITSLDDGGFILTWGSFAQRYDGEGNHIGDRFSPYGTDEITTLADGRTLFGFDVQSSGQDQVYNAIFDTRDSVTANVTGHDLFGDGLADSLIIRASHANNSVGGVLTMYAQHSGGLTQIGQVGTDWSVEATGDFNHDGRSDLLMRQDKPGGSDLYNFTMGPSGVTSISNLGMVGLDWHVVGTGDFNHDGTDDVLAEHVVNGARNISIIGVSNGAATAIFDAGNLGLNFQIDGIADLNHDGTADILTHYDDAGGRHLLSLNILNSSTQSISVIGTIGDEWAIDGMGDFNGDGYADILMHYDSADARHLGLLVNQPGHDWVFKDVGPVGKNIQIDGIGDFTGDGTADISAHYDSSATQRTNLYMEMHNSAFTSVHVTGIVGHEWMVS